MQDAVKIGSGTCLVRTVDTEPAIVAVGKLYFFKILCADINIWVALVVGINFMYYHINYICHMLSENKCLTLPVFHSFTGSETTSAFFGRGKNSMISMGLLSGRN